MPQPYPFDRLSPQPIEVCTHVLSFCRIPVSVARIQNLWETSTGERHANYDDLVQHLNENPILYKKVVGKSGGTLWQLQRD